MVAIPISAGGPSSTGARHQPPSAAARSCPRIAKFIFLVSFFDATVTNLPLAFPGRGQTCLCGRSKKDFPADDRYTRARSPIALSAGFGVGTCVIVYSWSPSFTTAPLAFPHRRPADSPPPARTFLPCNGSVQAPTWNPSRPIENLRDAHLAPDRLPDSLCMCPMQSTSHSRIQTLARHTEIKSTAWNGIRLQWPSFRDDYTGPIGMNGRFNPLFEDEDWIQCEIEEYARSGGGVGTAWYDTHLIDYYSQNTPCEFQSYGKAGYNKDAKPVPTVEYGRVENIVRIAHDAAPMPPT
ncbi:hypothetical protein B0H14DRAFT_3435463 [Mycena olivaceomarginata]|nr:hypothetical protein B0H14DRAFT_3435463 [Mycena olivaceomarginata]